ncbi:MULTISPECIES: hypothetical protein [unclassified Pseudomonas]|uniref:hypothetical protein n=1 Tax=unclassified Pseudomonas TaxID=196821 RepID=UPI00244C0F04|nr:MULTISPECIES: hypothetical protein [unclassified Pseudomonas]MDH0303625.1 hypothetical protein [Pseudomonas sp. GD04091]MDH1987074.1 hypothetical protein [Pseudomonas sp. GD03689]
MKSMTLLVIACVLSFTAQAEDKAATNCEAKIEDLEYISRTDGQALHGGMAHDYHELLKQAKAAQAKGDMATCQSSADRAKTIYNKARGK